MSGLTVSKKSIKVSKDKRDFKGIIEESEPSEEDAESLEQINDEDFKRDL